MKNQFRKDITYRIKRLFQKDLSLEERLALVFILTGSILSAAGAIVTLILGQPVWQALIHLFVAILCLLVVFIEDTLYKNTLRVIIFVGLTYFPFIYFSNAGNDGAGPVYFVLIVTYLAFYTKNRQFVFITTFFIVYFLGIMTIGQFYPNLVVPYNDTLGKYFDIIVAVLSVSVTIAVIASKTFKSYQDEHEIVIDLNKKLEEQNKKLVELSIKDQLTDVYNRRHFNTIIDKELEYYKVHNKPFHVMMIDLDDFKQVNDSFGHLFGDEVLRKVAQQINKSTRDYDVIARYGGEEFVVIVSHLNPENSITIAERIRLHVEKLELRHDVKMTVSIGLTSNCDEDTLETLVNRADELMYLAKEKGKNCVEYKGCR